MRRFTISMRFPFLFLLAGCLCSLNACKKSNSNDPKPSDTFISFKADGVLKTYTVAGFNSFTEGSTYECNINASDADLNSGESINLIVKSSSPVKTGTYGNDNSGTTIQYRPGNSLLYTVVNTDIQIVVTKFESSRVEGSFTASIPTAGSPIKLTEGVFKCGPRN